MDFRYVRHNLLVTFRFCNRRFVLVLRNDHYNQRTGRQLQIIDMSSFIELAAIN